MKTRTKVICVLVVVVVMILAIVPHFILSLAISTGMSELEVLLRAMNDELKDDEFLEQSEEISEEYVYYEIGVNCFDEIHQKILMTDWERVPDDANFVVNDGNGKYWSNCKLNCKGWAMLYALAAEICLREEVNPKGSEIIRPLDLIGELCCETTGVTDSSGAAKSGYLFNLINTYDMGECWLSEYDITGGQEDVLNLYKDGSSQPSWEDLSVYGFGSLFGNSLWPSMVIDPETMYYGGCMIYISSFEAPELDNAKRAVHGTRKGIHSNEGKYVDMNFWDGPGGYAKMETASTEEISSSIRFGTFNKNNLAGYKSRPAMYFLSDALYSQAVFLRAHIRGYNIESLTYYSDSSNAYIPNQISGEDDYAKEARKMLGMWLNVGVGVTSDSNWDKLVTGYSRFSSSGVNPIIEQSSTGIDTNTLMGYPGAFGRVYLQHETIGYSIASNKCTLFDDLDLALTYVEGNPWTYGFGCVNYGNFMKATVRAQIESAYAKYPKIVQEESTYENVAAVGPYFVAPLATMQIAEDGYPGRRGNFGRHYGLDLIASPGSQVRASVSGKWKSISVDGFNCVVLETEEYGELGKLCIVYGNVVPESGKSGTVRQGETIGVVQQYQSEKASGFSEGGAPKISGRSYVHFGIFAAPVGKAFDYDGLHDEQHMMFPSTSVDYINIQFIPPTMWNFYKDTGTLVELKPHMETVYYTEYNGADEEVMVVDLNLARYVRDGLGAEEHEEVKRLYEFCYNHCDAEHRLVYGPEYMPVDINGYYDIPTFDNYYSETTAYWATHKRVQAILDRIAEVDKAEREEYAAAHDPDALFAKVKSCEFGQLLTDQEYEAFTVSWGFDCTMNGNSLTYLTDYLTANSFGINTDIDYIREHALKENLSGYLHTTHATNGLDQHCGFYGNGWQCWAFATYVVAKFKGIEHYNAVTNEGKYCADGMQLKSYLVAEFEPGMLVRVNNGTNSQHSYIVLGASDDYIVIWDCNIRGNESHHCGVKLHRYSWDEITTKNWYKGTINWVVKPS